MKKNISLNIAMSALLTMGSIQFTLAQATYKIQETKDIDMKLSGTSTLHNWVMSAQNTTGVANFGFKGSDDKELTSLTSLTFSLIVTDLKSGEKGLDKNAYKALKADQYKDIDYKLTSATIMPQSEGKYLIKTKGKLTIAGVTKETNMDVYAVVNNNGSITCTGSDKLNMTDYSVKPPKFFLGAMKTGDEITLNYTLLYKKEAL
jgi:polyisoprenoid-binding protein YceI